MQRLDLLEILQRISAALKSAELLGVTQADVQIAAKHNPAWGSSAKILPLMLESKSGYDRLFSSERDRAILEAIQAPALFETAQYSNLLRVASQSQTVQQAYFSGLFKVFAFHEVLQRTLKVLNDLLLHDQELTSKKPEDSGVIIFQVSDFGLGISLEQYTKIFKLLSELTDMVGCINAPGAEAPSPIVVLLDSGSSANIGLKTTVENAKALFQIFKEVWDFVVNHKHYANKTAVGSLELNLSILEKIKAAEQNGTITPEKAKEYSTLLVRKADELLGLKVLPKEIAVEISVKSHIDLLRDVPSIKQITAGSNNQSAS